MALGYGAQSWLACLRWRDSTHNNEYKLMTPSRSFGVWVVIIYVGFSAVFNLVAIVGTNLGMIPLDKIFD